MEIPYQKFTLTIEAVEELHLPYYKGSTFRGGFGNMFRRIACALKSQDCTECMLRSKCIYAYIFETPPNENADIMNMHKYETVPHPFVIEPPEGDSKDGFKKSVVKPGEELVFNLILIGRATDYLPYFIYTFEELGKIGIGKGRGKYKLLRVNNGNNTVYSSKTKTIVKTETDYIKIPEDFKPKEKPSMLTLHFLTPVRIKYNRDLVVKPEFHMLIRALLRRLGLLYYFHCGNRKPLWDHKVIISHAEGIVIKDSRLKWFDWERYSTRQDTRMRLGGFVGEVSYSGDLESFLPYLRAGEILHIGKGTSFGLGKYEIG